MDELNEKRNRTKILLRSGITAISQYEEALPLCKELWDSFAETHNLWDAHQYANCLKKLNQIDLAESVCEQVYNFILSEESDSIDERAASYIKNLYGWILYEKYIKSISSADTYLFKNIVLDKLFILADLIESSDNNSLSFSYCCLKVLGALKLDLDKEKALQLLNRLDPAALSNVPYKYTDRNGKIRELASDREKFFQYRSTLLYELKDYENCILCCQDALDGIDQTHYDNDIWFERRIALAIGALGDVSSAIQKIEKLIILSDKWFLLYEVAKLYLQLGDKENALRYMLRAVLTIDPIKMKVKFIESLGDIYQENGIEEIAQKHYILSKQIREENDWHVHNSLLRKITNLTSVSLRDMKLLWQSEIYNRFPVKTGTISKIFPNFVAGYIKTADESFYFKYRNFCGRPDKTKIGDEVKFIVVQSYDRKKQIETEEAMVITPCKKGR